MFSYHHSRPAFGPRLQYFQPQFLHQLFLPNKEGRALLKSHAAILRVLMLSFEAPAT
jgi:hypothetical protein